MSAARATADPARARRQTAARAHPRARTMTGAATPARSAAARPFAVATGASTERSPRSPGGPRNAPRAGTRVALLRPGLILAPGTHTRRTPTRRAARGDLGRLAVAVKLRRIPSTVWRAERSLVASWPPTLQRRYLAALNRFRPPIPEPERRRLEAAIRRQLA